MGDWCILDDTSREMVRRLQSLQNFYQEKNVKILVKIQAEITLPVDTDFLMGDPIDFVK